MINWSVMSTRAETALQDQACVEARGRVRLYESDQVISRINEKGEQVNGRTQTPNVHDMLTGSQPNGTVVAGSDDATCSNWTGGGQGMGIDVPVVPFGLPLSFDHAMPRLRAYSRNSVANGVASAPASR